MYDQENEPTNAVSTKTESSTTATLSEDTARALIRRAKQASRRRFPSEEKIRILLEGVRAEISVAELCRREGIHPTVYYKWLKDFMEAGKKRLRGDTQREANREEVEQLRQENQRLQKSSNEWASKISRRAADALLSNCDARPFPFSTSRPPIRISPPLDFQSSDATILPVAPYPPTMPKVTVPLNAQPHGIQRATVVEYQFRSLERVWAWEHRPKSWLVL